MSEREEKQGASTSARTFSLKLGLIMVGLCLAVFLSGMDQTILATAAPVISNEFEALNDLGWWTAIYLLMLSVFQLFYGRLYSLFSIKVIYIYAIVIFEIGSLICTTAPNSVVLIFGRAISGVGAAGIFSGSILVTTKTIPLEKRAGYLGIMSGVFGIAAIVGPFIGGALTDKSTWRWCFGINLPLGVITIGLCGWLVETPVSQEIKKLNAKDKLQQFDLVGVITLGGSLVCLLLALQWGGSEYPWHSGTIIGLLVAAGTILACFIASQKYLSATKTIPSSFFQTPNICFAAVYAFSITGGLYVAITYIPVWFQIVRDYTALKAGIMLIPLICGYVICSIIAGILTSFIGYYNPAMIVGTILAIAGAGLLTTTDPSTSTAQWIGYLALYGSGVGFGFGQPSYVIQTLLVEQDVPMGVTLIFLVQNLSSSISVAVGQSIFQNRLSTDFRRMTTNQLDSNTSQFKSEISFPSVSETDKAGTIAIYSSGLIETMYIALGLSCVSVFGILGIKWNKMK